jgi:hypothetical protein
MRSRLHGTPGRILALVLATAALAGPAAAMTYVRLGDAELFDRSPVVVEARVAAVEAAAGSELPAIDYLVEVEELFKGFVPGSSLIVRVPGGVRPDGVGLRLWGSPRFAEGERALLFLTPRRDGAFALEQFALGAFHFARKDGRRIAYRDLEEAREVTLPGKAAADGARDLAAFRGWLRDRAAGRERAPDYFLARPSASPGPSGPEPGKYALIVSTREPMPFGCGEDGGHPVRWFDFDTIRPVSWRYQAHERMGLTSSGLPEFAAALQAWNSDPNTSVQYVYLGQTTITNGFTRQDGVNAVIFEDPNDEIGGSFSDGGVLALGGPWFLCGVAPLAGLDFHPIVEAEIITQDGAHAFFEGLADPSSAGRELFAHELGHTLGLAHTPRRESLMHAAIHDDGRGAAFHVDDLAAAYFLYGRLERTSDGPLPRPAPPSGLTATVADVPTVELAWTDHSDVESNFLIERRRRGEIGFRTVTTVPSGRNSYADAVAGEATYTYRVQAQNAAGRSGPSELIQVETPEDLRPLAPSHLWAAAVSRSRVRLRWRDRADNETGFVIQLKRQLALVDLPFVVPPDVSQVEVFGLTPGLAFTFRVRAQGDVGDSGTSNEATASMFPVDSTCASDERRLCMGRGRFAVEVDYRLPGGEERPAVVEAVTDDRGLAWFFHPGNVELLVRTVQADGSVLFVVTGSTHIEYRVRITDVTAQETWEIHHPSGSLCDPEPLAVPMPPFTEEALAAAAPAAGGDVEPDALSLTWDDAPAPRALGAASEDCSIRGELLCLGGGRFQAELTWTPAAGEAPVTARAATVIGDTGFFSLSEPSRPDVLLKVLDGRTLNQRFWAFASVAEPPVAYELRVRDTVTGVERTYRRAAGERCAVADLSAFSEAPAETP